nr:nitrous oxide-stimulated promoter family protein [Clostridium sp. JN-1]
MKVMRYSGPRMIIYHPAMSIEHLISKFKKH